MVYKIRARYSLSNLNLILFLFENLKLFLKINTWCTVYSKIGKVFCKNWSKYLLNEWIYASNMKKVCFQYFADCIPDIFISQTVDQRIQHGDQHCVKHGGQFDCVPWDFGVGHTVDEENCATKDSDGGQVSGTGEEDFVVPTSWMHL